MCIKSVSLLIIICRDIPRSILLSDQSEIFNIYIYIYIFYELHNHMNYIR